MAGTAVAKGPFRAEISGGELAEPITIEGPLPVELVFAYDAVEAAPPASLEPAYTIKLMPEAPDGATGEYPVLMTLSYFPSHGDAPALLRGDWDNGDRYFEASPEFQSLLEDAIGAAKLSGAVDDDDGVSAVWYIAPSLAAVGLMLIGGLAGRRLLFRHDE
jgi:hypothetical protein